MSKKIMSMILVLIGVVSGIVFLRFQGTIPLPVEIGLKIMPTFTMCAWLFINKLDNKNWLVFTGLIFSFLCDISMSLPGTMFLTPGIGCNMLSLIFFTVYFLHSGRNLRLIRVIPFAIIMGILFGILYNYLGANKIPVLVYCILYIVFLWRASARLGDNSILVRSQLICFFGSLIIALSDSLLSMVLFGVVGKIFLLQIVIMCLWWTGLFLMMVTARIEKKKIV